MNNKKGGTIRLIQTLGYRQVTLHQISTNSPRPTARTFDQLIPGVEFIFGGIQGLEIKSSQAQFLYKFYGNAFPFVR